MNQPRLMLLDTASLYFRAFHGLPDTITTPDGRPINAVRGLLDFISRLLTDFPATHLACCWDDAWRPQWRVDLLPSYKTHRVAEPATDPAGVATEEAPEGLEAQVPLIREVLTALGLPIIGVADHEADDVIGSLAKQATMPVDVVTGDRDLFQLVDDARQVRVVYVGRGISKADRVDEAWLREKYGIDAAAYADFAVLRGDPSDGIPGVAGIGVKTAEKLLNSFGSITGLLEAASDPEGGVAPGIRSKLAGAIDYLAVAGEVVRVVGDLAVPATEELRLAVAPADQEEFTRLTAELGLGSSADRILTALAAGAGTD